MAQAQYRLRVTAGPDEGQCFDLGYDSYTVGRAEDAEIRIRESQSPRRRFAVVWSEETESHWLDVWSHTNPVHLNDRRCADDERHPLMEGDLIRIGGTELLYERIPSEDEKRIRIKARLENAPGENRVALTTKDRTHSIEIPPKEEGSGSSANGGELLFLALATCYCNDVYREAAKRGIGVERVEVEVEGDFGAEGEPARNISYHVRVVADAPEAAIRELLAYTDTVAEVQNTLRVGRRVALNRIEVSVD
ncbi:MAG: OsmC family protein [Pyrinomonadaceae bacterium]